MSQKMDSTKPSRRIIKIASPYGDSHNNRAIEFFQIEKIARGRLRIRVTRTADLVDLTFELTGFSYIEDLNRLVKKRGAKKFGLRVIFPPQHIAETIHDKPINPVDGTEDCGQASNWEYSQIRPARPSELQFQINDPGAFAGPLSIELLTNWSLLELLVDDRARSNISLNAIEQIAALFPSPGGQEPDFTGVDTPVLLKRLEQARNENLEDVTKLELIRDLVFSSSEKAEWQLPLRPQTFGSLDEVVEIWSARLVGRGRNSLRAIQSHRLKSEKQEAESPPLPVVSDFLDSEDPLLALSMRNHWDIVAQSSYYGLPAMLKINDDNSAEDDSAALEAPLPTVVPVDPEKIRYLEHHIRYYERYYEEKFGHKDVGIALARPLSEVDLNLTALGAIMDINWKGDPPRLLLKNLDHDGLLSGTDFAFQSFNLERLAYQTWLGRDSRVEAVEKGYLLPLGIRASLLTICERKIYANDKGQPISFETRRKVIAIPGNEKRFPGPYQANAGRAFPAQRINMKTRVTPDLVDTTNVIEGLAPDSVFWPRVAGVEANSAAKNPGIDFEFEWETEDALAKSKLLFVINSVVGDPKLMEKIANDYYNKEVEHRRRVEFSGARQRYAKSDEPGDTSFDTNYWLMRLDGRMGGDGVPVFFMDGRLEGADQPPVYPSVEKANINYQALDQMVGEAQGGIDVAFYEDYLATGFTDEPAVRGLHRGNKINQNKGDIFLKVVDGEISLDARRKDGPAGGVATPNAQVAAFSRRIGMVGGEPVDSPAVDGDRYNFSAAKQGKFDPKQFLSGAKLLGIIDLGEIPKGFSIDSEDVPKLSQVVEYGAGTLRDYIGDAAREVRLEIYKRGGLKDEIKTAIQSVNDNLGTTGFQFEDLAGISLRNAINTIIDGNKPKLQAALEQLEIDPSVENVKTIASLVDTIVENVAAFLDDPVPPLVKEGLQALADILKAFRKGALTTQLRNYLVDTALRAATDSFCAAIDDANLKFGPILFGEFGLDEYGNSKPCNEIFRHPARAFGAMRGNLFGGAFEALVDIAWPYIVDVADLYVEVESYLELLEANAEYAIRQGLIALSDLLKPYEPDEAEDLRRPEKQTELLDQLQKAIKQAVKDAFGSTALNLTDSPFDDLARAIDEFEKKARAAIDASIRKQVSLLNVADVTEKERAVVRLVGLLQRELVDKPLVVPMRANLQKIRFVVGSNAHSMLKSVENLTRALTVMFENSELAQSLQVITGLKKDVTAGALAILERGSAPVSDLKHAAEALHDAANKLIGTNAWELQQLGERALKTANDLISQIADYSDQLDTARTHVTAGGRDFLDPMGYLIRLRSQMLTQLSNLISFALPERETALVSQTDDLVTALQMLYKTLAPAVHHGWKLGEIKSVIKKLEDDGTGDLVKAQIEALEGLVTDVEAKRNAVEEALTQVSSLADLKRIAKGELIELVTLVDRTLAAKVLQLTELPQRLVDDLKTEAGEALMKVWNAATDGSPIKIFSEFEAAINKIERKMADLKLNYPDVWNIMGYIIGGDEKLAALQIAFAKVRETVEKLAALGAETDAAELSANFKLLFDNDRPSSVQKTFEMFTSALDNIRVVDAGQAITQAISDLLRLAEAELLELAKKFVPTKLTTTYEWQTDIGMFPDSEDTAIFIPHRPVAEQPDGTPRKDLFLTSEFSFDFIDNRLTSTVKGRIAKFDLRLLSKDFDMATITFDKCEFSSTNGSKPDFDLKIGAVKMGPMLKFLEPLQKWLSPDGTGFYLTFLNDKPGIEAGYIYNAGIIQLGSLQFINVNFGVAAALPFDGSEAEFSFSLGSRKLPFMVANPPYGGGGFVKITATADGPKSMELSIFFGGVSAIRFGPLKAQGRIVAGLYVRSNSNGSYLLMAFFEAVGSGSVACFSVSVSLVVQLTQTSGGAMYGRSTFTFKFKLGFIKYKYRVVAHYKIKNGKSAQKILSFGQGNAGKGDAVIIVALPDKAKNWPEYSSLVDTSLIFDTTEVT